MPEAGAICYDNLDLRVNARDSGPESAEHFCAPLDTARVPRHHHHRLQECGRDSVLDANLYIGAAIRPEGPPGQITERFLRESAFELVVSPAMIDEVLRGFTYPKVRKYIGAEIDPEAWLRGIVLLADLIAGEYELTGISQDPDDDKHFAAAVEGRATFLVTGDPHLLDVKEHAGVHIVTPRRFLEMLD